jgi:DNA polymerase elongation subunit (family B)
MDNSKFKQISFEDIERLMRSKELSYFNIYNGDINATTYLTTKYYYEHQYDTINMPQKIRNLFIDIELDTSENIRIDIDLTEAEIPINAVTIIDSFTNEIESFILLNASNFNLFGINNTSEFNFEQFIINKQTEIINYLISTKYLTETCPLKISIFNDEKELLKTLCMKIHDYDPDTLSGWNIGMFDLPYMFNRLKKLFGLLDANKLLSKFGTVSTKNEMISIPDYAISDLLYLFRPREDGGLNLGTKQPQYSLDAIAKTILGIGKIEYKIKTIDLNDLYMTDPHTFLIYNIVDALLCLKLNDNLKHIDLYNDIRRIMKTSISHSMVGSSALFDAFVFYKLLEEGKYVRCGINNEQSKAINPEEFISSQFLKDKKGLVIPPVKINNKTFNSITSSFPGAFVSNPSPKIINDGSIIIDLDATALYPNMILQSNISFDSYYGRIIPVCTYKTLELLEHTIGKSKLPDQLYINIQTMVFSYVDKNNIDKKKETAAILYYIIIYLFNKLQTVNIPLNRIFTPSTTQESIVLKSILIPLLDLINLIHPDNPKHNKFMYDYYFMDQSELLKKYQTLYILHNAGESNLNICKYDINSGIEQIKNYCSTLAGTLFLKHSDRIGLFANFLINMGNMRREYKDKRDLAKNNAYEYNLNDSRQKSVKIIMNTTTI